MLSWLGSNLQEMPDGGDGTSSTERNSQSSSRTASNSPQDIQTEGRVNGESLEQAPTSRRRIVLSTQDDSTSGSEANSHNPSGVNTPTPAASEDTISQATLCDQNENSSRQTLLSDAHLVDARWGLATQVVALESASHASFSDEEARRSMQNVSQRSTGD